MSFIITWDADKIISELRACSAKVNDTYSDGFTQWGCKQDLYKVKFALDEMIRNSPKFVDEAKFLEEQEKKQIWKTLTTKD